MAHFSPIVQEWELHLYPDGTTGVFVYIIICKSKDGKDAVQWIDQGEGIDYGATRAQEAFRICDG